MQLSRVLGGIALVCFFAGQSACQAADEGTHLMPPLLRTRYGTFDPQVDPIVDLKVDRSDLLLRTASTERSVKIVQFTGTIQPAWRQALVDHGVQVRGYIPDFALQVAASPQDLAWLGNLPMVRAVIDMPRLWRLHPQLVQKASDGLRVLPLGQPQDFLVELSEEGVHDEVVKAVEAAGGVVVQSTDPAVETGRALQVRGGQALLSALAGHPEVMSVEPFVPLKVLNDVSYGMIQAGTPHESPIWDHGIHGQNQIVGLCDVGVFTNSCFFPSDKIVTYENITPVNQHDQSHGTHTAGSVAGDQYDNETYDTFDGMAPAAKLYVQDAGTTTTGELSLPADLGVLFKTAYAGGVRIHSDSWGGDTNSYSARERTLDAFVAAHRDFLVLLAAGNSGNQPGTIESPATAKNVISVGATDSASPETVVSFSSRGPTADGRFKPTLIAPGMRVVSASSTSVCGTATMSGTSMATPLLAGGAALVRQYYTDGFYPSGSANAANAVQPSAALLKATLIAGADDMQADADGSFPSNGQGFGRAHLANVLHFADTDNSLWMQDDNDGLEQGQTFTATVAVQGTSLHVALTWMDEPASAAATQALVNNLDLTVTTPDGRVLLGNNLQSGESVSGGAADETNVEEIVYLPHATPGTYTVSIRGANVPLGPQPFAVVASGASGAGGVTSPATVVKSAKASQSTSEDGGKVGCAATETGWLATLAAVLAVVRVFKARKAVLQPVRRR